SSKEYSEAERIASIAIGEDPDDSTLYQTLGRAKFEQLEYGGAVDAFSRASEINPKSANSYWGIAVSSMELDLWEDALRSWSKCLECDPGYGAAKFGMAVSLARL